MAASHFGLGALVGRASALDDELLGIPVGLAALCDPPPSAESLDAGPELVGALVVNLEADLVAAVAFPTFKALSTFHSSKTHQ